MSAEESAPFDFAAFASAAAGGGDSAPSDRRGRGRPKGTSKQQKVRDTLVTYYALGGMLVARANRADGELIVARSVDCADAWIAAGRSNPQIMRALEIITVAGPYTALALVHIQLVNGILDHHQASLMTLFKRSDGASAPAVESAGTGPAFPGNPRQPASLPYTPVGASAPTESAPPPPAPSAADPDELRVWPDDGLPSDVDVALREEARRSGRPYQELRNEAMAALAQLRMQANGHLVAPGALGAPVARE